MTLLFHNIYYANREWGAGSGARGAAGHLLFAAPVSVVVPSGAGPAPQAAATPPALAARFLPARLASLLAARLASRHSNWWVPAAAALVAVAAAAGWWLWMGTGRPAEL